MSHTETRTTIDEWQVEVCDNCGHEESYHYDNPERIKALNGIYMYTAFGCMVIDRDGRKLEGDNPYPRCRCTKFV